VRVEDTGPGIPDEQLDEIFDPFTQADQSHTRPKGGTGLGLAICDKLAELIGAELEVESSVGEGSVFRLVLPAQAG
jgi:signal transduction histidine kinase